MKKQFLFSSHRTRNLENIKKQKKKFTDVAKDIVRISDIILQVLDARFIEETRNAEFETEIEKKGKKLIYVLNKADLVKQKKRRHDFDDYVYVSAKSGSGVKKLRNKIKAMVKTLDIGDRSRAQVGIIGYPNTGKSSLINILTKRGATGTGAEAGFTKGMQKIRLTKDILILDTPGIIPESEYSHTKKEALQKQVKVGARTIDKIKDPDIVVMNLMKEYGKNIEKFYKVKAKGEYEVLLEELGRKRNFLKKGGVVDEDRTSRLVIRDWQEGRIRA